MSHELSDVEAASDGCYSHRNLPFCSTSRGVVFAVLCRRLLMGLCSLSIVIGLAECVAADDGSPLSEASMLVGQEDTAGDSSNDAASEKPAGFLQILFSGGITGALIMLVLLALSVVTAYLIIDHLLTVRRKDLMPSGLDEDVKNLLIAGKIEQAQQLCHEKPSLLAFVLLHGIAELEYGWSAVEKTLEDALAEQAARLFRKIEYLNVIGNLSPMVGLLGTVVGIVIAFQQVAQSQGAAGAGELASGIYQALVTTVGGLIVAIPALGAFAVFRNRVDQFVAEAAFLAQHVFGPLRKKKRSSERG